MREQYYIRVQGKVQGPFDVGELRDLRDAGRFRRFHEISRDGGTWLYASSLLELFPTGGVPEKQNATTVLPVARLAPVAGVYAIAAPIDNRVPASTAARVPQWHYLDDRDRQQGPVSQDKL